MDKVNEYLQKVASDYQKNFESYHPLYIGEISKNSNQVKFMFGYKTTHYKFESNNEMEEKNFYLNYHEGWTYEEFLKNNPKIIDWILDIVDKRNLDSFKYKTLVCLKCKMPATKNNLMIKIDNLSMINDDLVVNCFHKICYDKIIEKIK